MTDVTDRTIALYIPDTLARQVVAEQAAVRGFPVQFVSDPAQSAISVTGPVRLGALLQRVRQHLNQESRKDDIVPLGRFIFDPTLMILLRSEDGEEIALTEKESAILVCLAEQKGELISRRDLLTKVWGYAEGVETHTLETHIYRLRQKFESDPANPEILLTAEQGYVLKVF